LSASKAAAAPPGASAGEGSGGLHRIIRVRDGLAVSVGMVIGAGILRTPGLIASYLGDPRAILFIWVLGGVIAGLSTLMIAEMAAAMPSAGGKYVYAREAWGPTAGFVAGWAEIIVSRGFSGASKAVVIATYAIELAGRGNLRVVATALVLAFAVLHLGGLKAGTTFQNVSTVIKIIVLAGIAAAGIASGDPANFTASTPPAPEYAGLLGFALAYQAVAFAYYGWEDASKMAEEVRDPGKALPRILLGGAAAVAILYLLINISFIAALRPDEMAGSTLVARDAVTGVFGSSAGKVVQVSALLILISSLNVNFLATPRVAFALARDGLAPRAFSRVNKAGTPTVALLFMAAVILALAVSGSFETLIRFMMLVAISVDLVVLAGFFRLRRRIPAAQRPMTVPGYPILPALTVLLYVMVLATIVATQPRLAIGGGAMLAGLIIAGIVTSRAARSRARSLPG